MSSTNEAVSRVIIDEALEYSGWNLLDDRQVFFEYHVPITFLRITSGTSCACFGPEVTEQEAMDGQSRQDLTRGLLFKCYVASIEDQFEFVQQSWCNNVNFSQPNSGIDPIIGQMPAGTAPPFIGAAPNTEKPANKPQIPNLEHFVELQGGALTFLRRLFPPSGAFDQAHDSPSDEFVRGWLSWARPAIESMNMKLVRVLAPFRVGSAGDCRRRRRRVRRAAAHSA